MSGATPPFPHTRSRFSQGDLNNSILIYPSSIPNHTQWRVLLKSSITYSFSNMSWVSIMVFCLLISLQETDSLLGRYSSWRKPSVANDPAFSKMTSYCSNRAAAHTVIRESIWTRLQEVPQSKFPLHRN